ncbi:hypothetical protein CASFOL_032037 [Castilleja foliolosa]|uniref:Protein SCAR n=1 Tax=Castilleja foliolosa TaxID=1961234 RepID=A0ABD3C1G9_9LAMI
MPMSRYEIRNEYSLADPDLYRAADKDDPEALLEGVAMAGLAGVLRQLGDLAEFAAELFHDLHEEVLATAARGHVLMIRVQQLEAEVPSMEKDFLSQTDHSPFFNNAGVDWHPKQQMDQNLVTQGGLPRFVMDSYEECRGPPRLFLLDKFDVGGAGACLKRYTDPSFFKLEISEMNNADGHREKKNHKSKMRRPRRRNKETSEVQPMSHATFHPHLLEELVQNGIIKPTHRAKLKKRLQFSPFDSKSGGSYMRKLLKTPSPEHQIYREITMSSSPLRLSTNDLLESDLEVLETRRESPVGECAEIKRSLSPDRDEIMQIETVEKYIPVDGESNTESYVTGYHSDEVACEINNFVDAPSTIESGMDTDSEMRVKTDFTSPSTNNQQLVSVDNKERFHSLSSDSQSTGDLTVSDDANSSSKKETSSFVSNVSTQNSAENRPSLKMSAEGTSSADIPEIAIVDESSCQKTGTSNDDEKKINQIMDCPCSPSVSDSNSQSGNDSWSSTAGEHLEDRPNCENGSRISTVSDTVCHTKDSSAEMSDSLLHEDNYDHKDLIHFNNSNVLSQNRVDNAEMIPTESSLPGDLDDDVPELTEKPLSNDTDIAHSGDDSTSMLLRDEEINYKLYNEDLDIFSDVSNHSSCTLEAYLGKELTEISLTEATDAKELCSSSCIDNQVISETLISSPTENSSDLVEASLDAHDVVSISEDVTTVNKTSGIGNPESSKFGEVQDTRIIYDIEPNGFVAMESSSCTPENLENLAGTPDIEANDDVEPNKDVTRLEVIDISSYVDLKSPNEMHEPLEKSDSKTDKLDSGMVDSPSVTDIRENVDLPVGLDNSVKVHSSCFDGSGLDENEEKSLSKCLRESGLVKEDNVHLSESQTESVLVEEVDIGEASTSEDLRKVNNDHLKIEVSHTLPNSYIDSSVDTTQIQPPPEQRGSFDTDQESFVEKQVSDATSLSINCDTEETMLEKTELPPDKIDQESPSLLPIEHQKILDPDVDHQENPALSPELSELRNYDIDISGYPKDDPSGFIFHPINNNPFSGIYNQIDLDELPPLPPLPPVQWRMGKNPNASSITTTTEEEITKQNESFPQECDTGFSFEEMKLEREEKIETIDLPFKIENQQLQQQLIMPTLASEMKLEKEEKIEKIDIPLKIENEQQQQQLVMPTPVSEVTSPAAEENGITNETRTVKPPRPSNPLIESVAVLDKSKLRKASERVRPQLQTGDERDSFLEQIRAKSFHLKPAVASKPSIPAPQTNFNVAAILERANAIRQAFAGSDEDDEDNWSDS